MAPYFWLTPVMLQHSFEWHLRCWPAGPPLHWAGDASDISGVVPIGPVLQQLAVCTMDKTKTSTWRFWRATKSTWTPEELALQKKELWVSPFYGFLPESRPSLCSVGSWNSDRSCTVSLWWRINRCSSWRGGRLSQRGESKRGELRTLHKFCPNPWPLLNQTVWGSLQVSH